MSIEAGCHRLRVRQPVSRAGPKLAASGIDFLRRPPSILQSRAKKYTSSGTCAPDEVCPKDLDRSPTVDKDRREIVEL